MVPKLDILKIATMCAKLAVASIAEKNKIKSFVK